MKVVYVKESERTPFERQLIASAAAASRNAIAETFAAGIPITVLRGDRIVQVSPDGRETLIAKWPK